MRRILTLSVSLCLCGSLSAQTPAITCLAVDKGGTLRGSQSGVAYESFDAKIRRPLPTKLDHVHALTLSPDGTTLAVGGGSPAEAGNVELWSWPDAKPLGKLEGHKDVVYDVVWLDGGKRLATASADHSVRLWDVATRGEVARLGGHSGPVLCLAVSADGKWLSSGSADQTIRVWDPAKKLLVRAMTNHLGSVQRLAFRPATEGQPMLASASLDATVRIWQPAIGRMVRIVRLPTPMLALAWSGDGATLFTGGGDGVLRTLDGDSDRVLAESKLTPARITSLAVGGSRLAAGTSQGQVLQHRPLDLKRAASSTRKSFHSTTC